MFKKKKKKKLILEFCETTEKKKKKRFQSIVTLTLMLRVTGSAETPV